ncbi:MAG TPA: gamma-glutamylcyclotransferase [Paracoccus sp.]|nr:gamma-glutamylcyclotransferase [Paracoccus sp. (in: a-proteobacteria)]
MSDPCFFGYGSLVNRATHGYEGARRARLRGWRRAWRYTRFRPGPFLTAVPCQGAEIEGLVAQVPGADWAALDQREIGYARLPLGRELRIEGGGEQGGALHAEIYAVPAAEMTGQGARPPILLSYIDVVFQGYLREYGPEGVARFVATTDGWDAPILDDRTAPLYPRHQSLRPEERGLVDHHLTALGARVHSVNA